MALKTILLRKKLGEKQNKQTELRNTQAGYAKREAELAQAIEEAKTDEEVAAVEEAVEELENAQKTTKEALEAIQKEISDIIAQIDEAEKAQDEALDAAGDEGNDNDDGEERSRRRGEKRTMNNRMSLRDAQEFQRTGKHTYKDVRSFLRGAVLTTTDGVVGPTVVGGINDSMGIGISSFIDLLEPVDCTGMSSYKVAYQVTDTADADDNEEGQVPTEGEPTFDEVEIKPTTHSSIGYISKEIRKQTPLNYEEKVTAAARRALRRKLSKIAIQKVMASEITDTFELEGATGAGLFDAKLLSNIILAYGGEEEVEGAACLVLTKADLKAFAGVRGKNEYLPVYSIVPDPANPSTGVIKDNNGLSCRYCLNKNVKSLSTLTLTGEAQATMFYGNPRCAELALWGDYEVEVNDGYKFGEGLLTVRGEVTGDVDVVVNKGFVVVKAKLAE